MPPPMTQMSASVSSASCEYFGFRSYQTRSATSHDIIQVRTHIHSSLGLVMLLLVRMSIMPQRALLPRQQLHFTLHMIKCTCWPQMVLARPDMSRASLEAPCGWLAVAADAIGRDCKHHSVA
jgi:hypothetical protein